MESTVTNMDNVIKNSLSQLNESNHLNYGFVELFLTEFDKWHPFCFSIIERRIHKETKVIALMKWLSLSCLPTMGRTPDRSDG